MRNRARPALLALTCAGVGLFLGLLHTPVRPAIVMTDAVPSLDDILSARSPGPRPDGVLLQTKPAYPRQPRARPCPPSIAPQPAVYAVGSPPLTIDHGLTLAPTGFVDTVLAPVTQESDDWTPAVYAVPPVHGGPVVIIRHPVSPVPEPGTWVLMIGGLGLVGGVLRHRQEIVA